MTMERAPSLQGRYYKSGTGTKMRQDSGLARGGPGGGDDIRPIYIVVMKLTEQDRADKTGAPKWASPERSRIIRYKNLLTSAGVCIMITLTFRYRVEPSRHPGGVPTVALGDDRSAMERTPYGPPPSKGRARH